MTSLYEADLEQKFEEFEKADPRVAAEIAYALAVIHEHDSPALSRQYAERSVEIFIQLDIQELEDACPRFTEINRVMMPDLIHEGVVRARFGI